MNSCNPCKDVANCIDIQSPDGSIIVQRENTYHGVRFTLKAKGQSSEEFPLFLTYNQSTRTLCIHKHDGSAISCIPLPLDTPQTLTLSGNNLTISEGNTITLPTQADINVTSQSVTVNQSGQYGENIQLEISPSINAGNQLRYGTDGRLFVPAQVAPQWSQVSW